jgi:Cu(I)/Ag(I) efflux system membrane fusion protein
VSVGDDKKPAFEGREIALGPRAGDYYIVESGLEEGERVVTNGNFKIDSALQLLARPSMMDPEKPAAPVTEAPAALVPPAMTSVPPELQNALRQAYGRYTAIHDALVKDDIAAARASANDAAGQLAPIEKLKLAPEAAAAWAQLGPPLHKALHALAAAENDDAARAEFRNASDALTAALERFGLPEGDPVRLAFCPMAFDKAGAYWLQTGEDIQNPYLGGKMPTCGEIKRVLIDEHGHAPRGDQ